MLLVPLDHALQFLLDHAVLADFVGVSGTAGTGLVGLLAVPLLLSPLSDQF